MVATERTPLLDSKSNQPSRASSIASASKFASDPAVRSINRTRILLAISYASFSGIISGMCLLFAKSGVELLLLTIQGDNQFWRWQSWVLLLALVIFALLQLWYLHKGLVLADPTLVCPCKWCLWLWSSSIWKFSSCLLFLQSFFHRKWPRLLRPVCLDISTSFGSSMSRHCNTTGWCLDSQHPSRRRRGWFCCLEFRRWNFCSGWRRVLYWIDSPTCDHIFQRTHIWWRRLWYGMGNPIWTSYGGFFHIFTLSRAITAKPRKFAIFYLTTIWFSTTTPHCDRYIFETPERVHIFTL